MDNKDFLMSKTTWGAFFILAEPVFTLFGFDLDTDSMVQAITTAIGSALFIYGQFRRKTTINSIAGFKIKY